MKTHFQSLSSPRVFNLGGQKFVDRLTGPFLRDQVYGILIRSLRPELLRAKLARFQFLSKMAKKRQTLGAKISPGG